jgi:leucyl/phenylalanyl-tRNA--protein transferase
MLYQLSYTPAGKRPSNAALRQWQATSARAHDRWGGMHGSVPDILPVKMLLLAYRSGIFPMSDSRDDPQVFWVEPRERAVIPLGQFHLSRSLAKVVRQDRYRVTCNADFSGVLQACAAPRPDESGALADTWINHKIAASYLALHHAGHAHSIECWLDGEMVGGLYGVSFNRAFCGESMFSTADNASKVALAWLVAAMRRAGFRLLDCQFMTDHLATLGATTISREDYLARLELACEDGFAADLPAAIAQFSAGAAGAGVAAADGAAKGGAAGVLAAFGAAGAGGATTASSPGKLIAQSFIHTS